jgi:hypothetical protein
VVVSGGTGFNISSGGLRPRRKGRKDDWKPPRAEREWRDD